MATRIYLPSSGAADVTPSTWNFPSQAATTYTLKGVLTKGSTALTTRTTATGTTSPNYKGVMRYVIGPLAASQISGTVNLVMMNRESNANANAQLAIAVKIIQPGGSDRSVLLGYVSSDSASSPYELTTTISNRRAYDASEGRPISLTSQTPTAGDYLVIEIGFRSATTTDRNIEQRHGDNSGSDLADADGNTDDYAPWVEFSANIQWNTQLYEMTMSDGGLVGGEGGLSRTKYFPISDGGLVGGEGLFARVRSFPVADGGLVGGESLLYRIANHTPSDGALGGGLAGLTRHLNHILGGPVYLTADDGVTKLTADDGVTYLTAGYEGSGIVGGALIGGQALYWHTGTGQVYEMTMDGGALAGGLNSPAYIFFFLPSDGAIDGGSASLLRVLSMSGLTGALVGGLGGLTRHITPAPTDGALAGGSIPFARIRSYPVSDGALAGGTIIPTRIVTISPTDGALAGGLTSYLRYLVFSFIGGGLTGGTTPYEFVGSGLLEWIMQGGALAGGLSSLNRLIVFPPSAGSITGGSSAYLRILKSIADQGGLGGGSADSQFLRRLILEMLGGALSGGAVIPLRIIKISPLGGALDGGSAGFTKISLSVWLPFSSGGTTEVWQVVLPGDAETWTDIIGEGDETWVDFSH